MLAEKDLFFAQPLLPTLYADARPVSIVTASTQKLREEAYRIRHEVYCNKLHFEDDQTNTTGLETDRYDGWSKHFLIRDELSGKYVGTIRLVIPSLRSISAIPIEQNYHGEYFDACMNPLAMRVGTYLEVSRLAILPPDEECGNVYTAELARMLYLKALAYFNAHSDLKHMFCFMERRLGRRLTVMGLPFSQAGEFVEFKGARAPYYMNEAGSAKTLRGTSKTLYDRIFKETLTEVS